MAARARCRRSAAATPRASRPSSTFPKTVSQGNSANVWNTTATPGHTPATGAPLKAMCPEVGCSRPAMARNSVDLPEPERPSSPTISPALSVSATLSSTVNGPAGPLS